MIREWSLGWGHTCTRMRTRAHTRTHMRANQRGPLRERWEENDGGAFRKKCVTDRHESQGYRELFCGMSFKGSLYQADITRLRVCNKDITASQTKAPQNRSEETSTILCRDFSMPTSRRNDREPERMQNIYHAEPKLHIWLLPSLLAKHTVFPMPITC